MAREDKVGETMDRMKRRESWARALVACLAVCLAAACGSGDGGQARGEAGAGGQAADGAAAGEQAPSPRAPSLPAPGMAWVIFGADTVLAEVASTQAARERGLMDRSSVPDGTGMLFVFPRSEERSFWMKDTHVPLDIAFFGDSNQVFSIKQMEPLDETFTASGGRSSLALEVRQGWFAEQGIEVGAVAQIVFGPGLQIS